jgi:hypothetical protein
MLVLPCEDELIKRELSTEWVSASPGLCPLEHASCVRKILSRRFKQPWYGGYESKISERSACRRAVSNLGRRKSTAAAFVPSCARQATILRVAPASRQSIALLVRLFAAHYGDLSDIVSLATAYRGRHASRAVFTVRLTLRCRSRAFCARCLGGCSASTF